jgi:hypothetical protein
MRWNTAHRVLDLHVGRGRRRRNYKYQNQQNKIIKYKSNSQTDGLQNLGMKMGNELN